ncbi:hypothetical protein PMI01_04918, partial [Caulobacter sp. AP07]|uniref:hypothetical protein n=1 Tax=Caulobacter sp. AP07 TaxID=1144304 RepID=UPI000271F821
MLLSRFDAMRGVEGYRGRRVYGEVESIGPVGFEPAGDWVLGHDFQRWTPTTTQTVDGGRRYWLGG